MLGPATEAFGHRDPPEQLGIQVSLPRPEERSLEGSLIPMPHVSNMGVSINSGSCFGGRSSSSDAA